MLVTEIVSAIENQRLMIKELSEAYGVSDRTITTKIKDTGYTWNPRTALYELGRDENEIADVEIENLFHKEVPYYSSIEQIKAVQPEIDDYQPDRASVRDVKVQHTKTPRKASRTQNKPQSKLNTERLDYLFNEKKTVYKGYYIDSDVLEVLNNVAHGNKSEVVNEALRLVFESRGLL